LKRWLFGKDPPDGGPRFPAWLDPAFAQRLELRARWAQVQARQRGHPRRPYAVRVLTSRNWVGLFESYEPGVTSCPVEVRHPLLDLRVVDYLLSIPAVPWCIDKRLLRMATSTVLPEAVRRRPKAPLAGDPVGQLLRQGSPPWASGFAPAAELARYVDCDAFRQVAREEASQGRTVNMSPVSLYYWLRRYPSLAQQEGSHDDERVAAHGVD